MVKGSHGRDCQHEGSRGKLKSELEFSADSSPLLCERPQAPAPCCKDEVRAASVSPPSVSKIVVLRCPSLVSYTCYIL